ncbi:antibiotic biosynthesis monooxygenase family protein [Candidatus Nitrosocosmicus franklandus]|uniref:Heme-degrading monooxygenase HmoB n=1 Tax=Candidatus Nitrosocosmicus franklandianus TaxID=1798806 RepID=A0A484ICA6_9ARCH|nr:antibiotic biosynthesis monooxygenase [Candidatus Nitrosocosmicus franklandus]VFJ14355.1 Heme-degrading monooxygenase HmoB [Candidatus Nitrosocosmicus franklandus]
MMIIVLGKFPAVYQGKEEEFEKWFNWSNQLLKGTPGLISRRLVKDRTGNYFAIVEFDSFDAFKAMHSSDVHKLIHKKASLLLNGMPKPEIFEVINTIS